MSLSLSPILGRFLERFVDNLPKGPTGMTLLVDTTVYEPKHLDGVGRCECCWWSGRQDRRLG